jgi:hypothetical protein
MLWHNILAFILDLKHRKYQLGTANGILLGYFLFKQLSKALEIPTLHLQDVPDREPKSLREVTRLQSVTGGQGRLKYDCKGGSKTNRCECEQAKVLCNSHCHHSAIYDNN